MAVVWVAFTIEASRFRCFCRYIVAVKRTFFLQPLIPSIKKRLSMTALSGSQAVPAALPEVIERQASVVSREAPVVQVTFSCYRPRHFLRRGGYVPPCRAPRGCRTIINFFSSRRISRWEVCISRILIHVGTVVGENTAGYTGGVHNTIVSSTMNAELRTAILRFLTQIRTTNTVSPSRPTRLGSSSTYEMSFFMNS